MLVRRHSDEGEESGGRFSLALKRRFLEYGAGGKTTSTRTAQGSCDNADDQFMKPVLFKKQKGYGLTTIKTSPDGHLPHSPSLNNLRDAVNNGGVYFSKDDLSAKDKKTAKKIFDIYKIKRMDMNSIEPLYNKSNNVSVSGPKQKNFCLKVKDIPFESNSEYENSVNLQGKESNRKSRFRINSIERSSSKSREHSLIRGLQKETSLKNDILKKSPQLSPKNKTPRSKNKLKSISHFNERVGSRVNSRIGTIMFNHGKKSLLIEQVEEEKQVRKASSPISNLKLPSPSVQLRLHDLSSPESISKLSCKSSIRKPMSPAKALEKLSFQEYYPAHRKSLLEDREIPLLKLSQNQQPSEKSKKPLISHYHELDFKLKYQKE